MIHNATVPLLRAGEAIAVLKELQREGLVRYIGASTYGIEAPRVALEQDEVDALQIAYNVLDQRLADDIFIEELHKQKLYDETSQAFAVFLPVKSVGVMGDVRRYEYVIALRAVETIDFMTARWARLPYEFLEHVSLRIINEVNGISRVTYDISGKPPATIEWE